MINLQPTGRTALGLYIGMLIAAILVVTLRFVAKRSGEIKLGPEDAFIIAALSTFIAFNGVFFQSELSPLLSDSSLTRT